MIQNKKQNSIVFGVLSICFVLIGILSLLVIIEWIGILLLIFGLMILIGQIVYISFK